MLANHAFPGEYIVKAFGPGRTDFGHAIASAAYEVVGEERATVLERTSRAGNKVCVTVRLNAETVDEVLDVYERIHRVESLLLIL